jgi:hypothetical protein
MGRLGMRSAFVAAMCAGVAMVGASVHGLFDVDAELQRSVMAAQQQRQIKAVTFTVSTRERQRECPAWPAPPPRTRERA